MDWIAILFGLALGISCIWFFVGYLVWKRIDVLWEYARSLDRSDASQMELIDLLAIHTGIDVRREREHALTLAHELNKPENDGAEILVRDKNGKLRVVTLA